MITFYSMSEIEGGEDFWQRVNNIDSVMSLSLAKVLNDKVNIEASCSLHPGVTNEIGIIYTDNNIEFIATVFCCEGYKEQVMAEIEKLNHGLSRFFG